MTTNFSVNFELKIVIVVVLYYTDLVNIGQVQYYNDTKVKMRKI